MERSLGSPLPPDWPGDAPVEVWTQRAHDPAGLQWSARAVILRETGAMIGHAGFHLPPGADEIAEWAPGGVEIGYTVFEAYRRRGYAAEATRGLVDFARENGVPSVLATTTVGNIASRGVLQSCGFERVDQVLEDDIVEDVWILPLTP